MVLDDATQVLESKTTKDNNLLESVIGFDALYSSMYKCRKGVMWKGSVASFFLNGIEKTLNLEKKL